MKKTTWASGDFLVSSSSSSSSSFLLLSPPLSLSFLIFLACYYLFTFLLQYLFSSYAKFADRTCHHQDPSKSPKYLSISSDKNSYLTPSFWLLLPFFRFYYFLVCRVGSKLIDIYDGVTGLISKQCKHTHARSVDVIVIILVWIPMIFSQSSQLDMYLRKTIERQEQIITMYTS